MIKILRKSFRKRIAILLLAVFLIPLVPIVPVSATGGSPFPFDYPSSDTFYPVDFVIKLFNAGSADYLRVRTDIGQKIAHWVFMDTYTLPVTPDPFSKYTFYDDLGNVVDNPFSNTNDNNLLLVRDDYTDLTGGAYGIVVASNATLTTYEYGESLVDSDSYIYFYQNYMSYAATPTPIPEPTLAPLQPWSYYPDLPSNFSSQTLCIMKYHSSDINDGKLIGLASSYIGSSCQFNYPTFYKDRRPYNFNSQALCEDAVTINTWSNYYYFSVFTVNYDEDTDTYSVGGNLHNTSGSPPSDAWYLSTAHWWNGETIACWSVVPNGSLIVTNRDAVTVDFGSSYFELLFTNKNYTPGSNVNPNATPTPTTMPTPTFVPQPSEYPTPPADPPDEGEDGNWTGLFGWIKKLVNAILSIPARIVSGILSALKYIFIPDIGRLKDLFNTLNTKFGIQKPVLFDFDPVLIDPPENVVMHFKPISLNGEPTEPVDITIIDFEKVDDWLESEQGMIMTRIIQAVFAITMWGYMMYIVRKHVATINYTDGETLKDKDTEWPWKKGGDN